MEVVYVMIPLSILAACSNVSVRFGVKVISKQQCQRRDPFAYDCESAPPFASVLQMDP